jgi:hypothetical protein
MSRIANHQLTLRLGLVGPATGADEIQTWFHEIIGSPIPQGWDTQLKNEPIVNLFYQYNRRLLRRAPQDRFGFDFSWNGGGGAGNYYIGANVGLTGRVGWRLPDNYPVTPLLGGTESMVGLAPPRKKFVVYAYLGAQGFGVLRWLPTDGNTVADSRSGDRDDGFFSLSGGIVLGYSRVLFSYRYHGIAGLQDPENFKTENRNDFGTILITVFLGYQRQKGMTTIVRAEGSPAISGTVVDELGWLALLEPARMGRLKIVLIGDEPLERQLAAPRMQALRQMTRWQHRLESLSETESLDYLEFRLEAAGCPRPAEIFSEEAGQRIHRVATGLPAQLNRLATAALVAAAATGARRVEAGHVVVGSEDLRAAVKRRSNRQRVASLDIVLENRPLGRIGLTSPRMLIGRHPWNDVQLDDESVSRHHALLVREGGYWTLVDLNSTNGVQVNERPVRQQRLRHGDKITVGRFCLELDEGRSPETELPPAGDFGETIVLNR